MAQQRHGSVVRRRILARQLRLLREQAGLTLEEAAPKLDWSVASLSRIETAQQGVSGFTILNFGDLGEPDIAYVEHSLGALILDKEHDVTRARLAFDRIRADALDPAESLAMVRRLAEQA